MILPLFHSPYFILSMSSVWCVRRNKMCTSYDQNCNFVPKIRFGCLLFAIHFLCYSCICINFAFALQCSVQKVFIKRTQPDWNGHKFFIDDARLFATKSLHFCLGIQKYWKYKMYYCQWQWEREKNFVRSWMIQFVCMCQAHVITAICVQFFDRHRQLHHKSIWWCKLYQWSGTHFEAIEKEGDAIEWFEACCMQLHPNEILFEFRMPQDCAGEE